jgi:hypothetical protein
VFNLNTASSADALQRIRWPHIRHYLGHDLYVGFAADPIPGYGVLKLQKGQPRTVGQYTFLYTKDVVQPGKLISADLFIKTADSKVI